VSSPDKNTSKNISLALNLSLIVVGMLGLAYASVPLYRMFCEYTGYGGTTRQQDAQTPSQQAPLGAREITVRFNADIDPALPWDFAPGQHEVKVRVGQQLLTHYVAHNRTDKSITGHAVYNVVPFAAGAHFVKIDCFCFSEQTLAPGQQVNMPVLFFVSPSILDDPDMKDVKTITLSYTFFSVKTGTNR